MNECLKCNCSVKIHVLFEVSTKFVCVVLKNYEINIVDGRNYSTAASAV